MPVGQSGRPPTYLLPVGQSGRPPTYYCQSVNPAPSASNLPTYCQRSIGQSYYCQSVHLPVIAIRPSACLIRFRPSAYLLLPVGQSGRLPTYYCQPVCNPPINLPAIASFSIRPPGRLPTYCQSINPSAYLLLPVGPPTYYCQSVNPSVHLPTYCQSVNPSIQLPTIASRSIRPSSYLLLPVGKSSPSTYLLLPVGQSAYLLLPVVRPSRNCYCQLVNPAVRLTTIASWSIRPSA